MSESIARILSAVIIAAGMIIAARQFSAPSITMYGMKINAPQVEVSGIAGGAD